MLLRKDAKVENMDYTILVNKEHLLLCDYVPEGLVEINEPMGSKLDKTYVNRLNSEVYAAFKQMQKDALKAGYEIFIDSSYRSYGYQDRIFNDVALKKGTEYAERFVAMPGASEHQTGLAIDIIYRRNSEMIEEQTEDDAEIKWLCENAHKYGFILRYPKGKEKITGFNFEPWHFRYVGKIPAEKIFAQNITLEEYHELLKI